VADRIADRRGWLLDAAQEDGVRDVAFDPLPGQLAM
jgi:hypothetical protein